MRIREESPFYGITEEQKELFLDEANQLGYMRIAELWEMRSGKKTTEGQVKRFLRRLRYERALRETDDSQEDLAAFAQRATDGKARDGMIEAARQKLFEEALAKGDQALLLELYKAANEERAREREVVVEQRKAAVAEENAKIGWMRVAGGRKVLQAAVASSEAVIEAGAAEEPKLLPLVREVLADPTKKPEERIAAVLEFLATGASAEGMKLLGDRSGPSERAMLEVRAGLAGGHGEGEKGIMKAPAPPPTIDWDAPLRELIASRPVAHLYTEEELRAFEEAEAAKAKAKEAEKKE